MALQLSHIYFNHMSPAQKWWELADKDRKRALQACSIMPDIIERVYKQHWTNLDVQSGDYQVVRSAMSITTRETMKANHSTV